ncbi:hypothetical protein BDZ97DRAFT_1822349 [Flammula alnicola]|nr:hypothetical protein BDZ97DRAFT_1822349 [Flammula alnicola]
MNPELVLPVEILDHIFTFMRNDLPSLRACANVNQMFHDIVDKHFYHQVTLHNIQASDGQISPPQLSKLLVDSPHIAKYVRSLEIIIASPGILKWFMTRSLNDEEIAPILPLLAHLERISVTGRRSGRIAWEKLHPTFQSSLIRSLCSRSVEQIVVNGVDNFPLSSLNHSTALKRLSLVGNFDLKLDFGIDVANLGLLPENLFTRPRLEGLAIRHCSPSLPDILEWLQQIHGSPDISGLVVLDIAAQRSVDLDHFTSLLKLCSSTLRILELDPGHEVNTVYNMNELPVLINTILPPPPLDLSKISHLQSLTIAANIWSADDFWVSSNGEETLQQNIYSTPFSWIIQLLDTLPSHPLCLERITLEFSFRIDKHTLGRINWGNLANTLSSKRLSSLQRVELWVWFERTPGLDCDTLVSMLKSNEHLSELIQRGLLVVFKLNSKYDVNARL